LSGRAWKAVKSVELKSIATGSKVKTMPETRRQMLRLFLGVAAVGCSKRVVSFQEIDEAGLMSRWNAVDGVVDGLWDFRWQTWDEFPHPTFKGGSAEAYQRFAVILLGFYDANFDYLAQSHQFRIPLSSFGLMTSFVDLTETLIAEMGLSDDTRTKLLDYDDRIQAVDPVT
jgi:hypothetical protein